MVLGFGALWSAQQATTQQILDLERSTTDRILAVQHEILELQRSTTERLLEMQQQSLDLQRETQRG